MRKGIKVYSIKKKELTGDAKKQFYKENHLMFGLAITFSVLSSMLSIVVAIILKEFIDIGSKGFQKLIQLFSISIMFILANITINFLEAYTVNKYVKKAMLNINYYFNEKVLEMPIRMFNRNKNGRYISLLNNDLKIVEQDYVKGIIYMIAQGGMIVLGLITMIYINLKLTVIVLISAVLPLLISVFSVKKIEMSQEKVAKVNGQFTAFVKDCLSGFPVIKSFHIEKEIHQKSIEESKKLEMIKEKYQRIVDMVAALSQNSTVLMVIILFVVGAAFTIKGEMTIGGILAFVQLLNNVTSPINFLIPAYAKYKAAAKILEDADKLVSKDGCSRKHKNKIKSELISSIRMQNVSFNYGEDQETVINNINFEFEKGKSYAIVGISGSGKSTLLRLLAGYYDNYKGEIYIDNVELRDLSEESTTKLISLIQQDTFIFDDSIEKNIKLYQEWSEEKFNNVVEKAVLTDFIQERGGIQTICGENGQSFSGGQKQRISVARALLKESPILLLDEVSSALDLQTTYQLEESLASMKNVTRIGITHKLDVAVLKNYDCIIFIKNGKIMEYGNMEELIAAQGEFWSLYELYTHQ